MSSRKFENSRLPIIEFIDKETRSEKIITKYFDPKYINDINKGRFRFGTNRGYRRPLNQVAELGTLDDETEGDLIFDFDTLPSKVNDFATPMFRFVNSITPQITLKIAWWVNDHTFCATYGKYDPSHHELMLRGWSAEHGNYIGNPSYTSFCEIDFPRFIKAAMWNAKRIRDKKEVTPSRILAGRVIYENFLKSIKYHGILPENYSYSRDAELHARQAAFSKAPRFSIEKEVRLITPLYALGRTPVDAEPIYFQSPEMKASIIRIGEF